MKRNNADDREATRAKTTAQVVILTAACACGRYGRRAPTTIQLWWQMVAERKSGLGHTVGRVGHVEWMEDGDEVAGDDREQLIINMVPVRQCAGAPVPGAGPARDATTALRVYARRVSWHRGRSHSPLPRPRSPSPVPRFPGGSGQAPARCWLQPVSCRHEPSRSGPTRPLAALAALPGCLAAWLTDQDRQSPTS